MASPPSAHVLLVTAPLQGHVNPLLVLGKRLASRGLLVTISTVPHAGLKNIGHGDDGASIGVGRGTLRFEHLRGDGLWAPEDQRYQAGSDVMSHIYDAAPAALAALIRRQAEPVTCVVVNIFAPWALRVAAEFDLPHAVLWTESCAVLSLYYHHFFHEVADFPAAAQVAALPGMPPIAAADLPGVIHAPEQLIWRRLLLADLRALRETASWVLVNTFAELEQRTIDALRAHLPLPVLPVGPLLDFTRRGQHHDEDDDADVAAWLDAQPPRSVVFAAFGSLLKLTRDEAAELAAGLAATGRPFLWVLRDDNRRALLHHHPDGKDDCLAPATTNGSKGSVVPWCTQGRVLSHPAVGCFVTHCGWNSAVEALAAGVPVVAYPAWADQPTNAWFLTDVCGVGVRLPRPMAREAVRRGVDEVMVSGPARGRAGEWKAEATAALAAGGSSDKATEDFVDALLSIGTRRDASRSDH